MPLPRLEIDKLFRKFITSVLLIAYTLVVKTQTSDSLFIHYYNHSPFAYSEKGSAKGIEVEIVNEYILWLKVKKKAETNFRFVEYSDFASFYSATKTAKKNTIGLGSVTLSQDRLKEVDFSTPYLKSVAFCITNGHAPDVKTKSADEIIRSLGSMNALTLSNTSLNKYVNELKKSYLMDMKVSYHTDETKILDEISKNVLLFGYVDAITFWFYLKNNPGKFLKMQKSLSQSKEQLAVIFPKGSSYKATFDEFFTGFKTSPVYRAILEKHLGTYMTQNVAID